LRDKARGKFGKQTAKAIAEFRKSRGLPAGEVIDKALLKELIAASASAPIASLSYLTLVLDIPATKMTRMVSLVAIVEGAGKFGAICKNNDTAGLSMGIIQWAQKPTRLAELLEAFKAGDPLTTHVIFGGETAFNAMLAHTKVVDKPTDVSGGVKKKTGNTINSKFDLVKEPWLSRFVQASLSLTLQKVQVQTAVTAFETAIANIVTHMPRLKSQREVAFGLDLGNQHGDTNKGAWAIYDKCKGETDPTKFLEAMRDESVSRLKAQFKKQPSIAEGGLDRRNFFITTKRLSDDPF
jgi:peptidoglycan hydrolase-like protein with peptidoglycan-binding domain